MYFGLLRSLNKVYQSHIKKINNVLINNNIDFKVFLHSWKTKNNTQKIWGKEIKIKQNYQDYKYLNPYKVRFDSQEEFINTIDISDYYKKNAKKEWLPCLIKNHLCALESQNRVLNLACQDKLNFDYVIFVRPDVLIIDDLPIKKCINYLNINKKGIVIPNDHHNCGYNDRFSMINMEYSNHYGNRIKLLKEYRLKHGRITSEKYTKYIIKKFYHLLLINFKFKIVRPS